jgi:amino acid adenylation domain-containing protein
MLQDYLIESGRSYADRPALKIRDQLLSYRELAAQAGRFAQMLWAHGILPGTRVALWLPKEISTYIAIHGTVAAGCTYVPLDLSAPPKRVAWILEDSRSEVLICRTADAVLINSDLPATLQMMVVVGKMDAETIRFSTKVNMVGWHEIWTYDENKYSDAHLSRDPEMLAYVLYTSGSTGTPKGVAISHRAAQAFVDWSASLCALEPVDRVSNQASLTFDLSIFDIFATARAGACLCPVPVVGLASGYVFSRFIEEEAITVWYSVPSVLTRIAQQQEVRPLRLTSLRLVIFAGEPFHKAELQRLCVVLPGVTLYNWYGPTETNVCTWHQVTEADIAAAAALPLGKPCPYASIVVLAEGEALVRGASLLSGYMRHGELDRSALISLPERDDGPYYRTGDFVSYRADGCLLYHGRRDSQFKHHGYRIEAGEIEEVTRAMPGIQDAAVVLAKERMILYVAACLQTSKQEILAGLVARLSAYMIPDDVVVLSELPRNDRGKVDRLLLRAMTAGENG